MQALEQWLTSLGIEVVAIRGQPDGARRLVLRFADGSLLEVSLSRALLAGNKEDVELFINSLLKDGRRPRKIEGRRS